MRAIIIVINIIINNIFRAIGITIIVIIIVNNNNIITEKKHFPFLTPKNAPENPPVRGGEGMALLIPRTRVRPRPWRGLYRLSTERLHARVPIFRHTANVRTESK